MYNEEYKRWMAADLEDADLNYLRLKEMMRKSRSALLFP